MPSINNALPFNECELPQYCEGFSEDEWLQWFWHDYNGWQIGKSKPFRRHGPDILKKVANAITVHWEDEKGRVCRTRDCLDLSDVQETILGVI